MVLKQEVRITQKEVTITGAYLNVEGVGGDMKGTFCDEYRKEIRQLKLKVRQLTNENTNLRLADKEEVHKLREENKKLYEKYKLAQWSNLGSIGGLHDD